MTLYIGADNSVIYDELKDASTEAVINNATVTFTLYRQVALDAVMTASSAVLTSATGPFVVGDVGRSVVVRGAGTNRSDLRTTIAGFTSATSITLTAAASTTVSNAHARMSITNATAVSMSYVTGTDGQYLGTIDEEVVMEDGATHWVEISVDAGSDRKDFRVLKDEARYRE